MTIKKEEVEKYLSEVKTCVRAGRYEIHLNQNRKDNIDFFTTYIVDEVWAKEIILSLEAEDFSNAVPNRKAGYEHETLYIFGKDVELIERFGNDVKTVSLYIKFNKIENSYVIVVSFHEQKRRLSYYFR